VQKDGVWFQLIKTCKLHIIAVRDHV